MSTRDPNKIQPKENFSFPLRIAHHRVIDPASHAHLDAIMPTLRLPFDTFSTMRRAFQASSQEPDPIPVSLDDLNVTRSELERIWAKSGFGENTSETAAITLSPSAIRCFAICVEVGLDMIDDVRADEWERIMEIVDILEPNGPETSTGLHLS